MAATLHITLGNQLVPIEHLPPPERAVIFMAEDISLCTYVRHHKQKLVLFLAAMRHYADELRRAGYDVRYHTLDDDDTRSYEDKLSAVARDLGTSAISHFEIEDKSMEQRITRWAAASRMTVDVAASPMFLCSRERFAAYLASTQAPHMADFYRAERRRLGVLVEADGSPHGGRWSFDAENRKRLPRDIEPPSLPRLAGADRHLDAVTALVARRFADHPGDLGPFWLPATRAAAIEWLDDFLEQRFADFGPYEDAISRRSRSLFHSVLSPSLNLGLLTPREVVERALAVAETRGVPINSVEGFVRQIIGWREFIRGIYRNFSEQQDERNFWNHEARLTDAWYTGETQIPPLDDAIRNATRFGWDHHIVRLMVIGNVMTLAGIAPREAHRWFMEMYVDSSEWVMGPNVYGMALYSDGGVFATKPYICGSNYMLKMSDYKRGPWCDIVDGLYWSFVDRHRDFFMSNPRLAMMPRTLDRIDGTRKRRLFAAADRFREQHTVRR